MKIKLSSLIFVAIFLISTQFADASIPEESEKIYWDKDTPLQWSDFQGTIDTFPDDTPQSQQGDFDAFTRTWLDYYYEWDYLQQDSCVYKVTYAESWASFVKSESWIKSEFATDELLNHEQRHFDIYKIGELRLNQGFDTEFLEKEVACPTVNGEILDDVIDQKIASDFDLFFYQITSEIDQLNIDYDSQTDHSFIEEQQLKWNQNIDCLLENIGDETKCIQKQIVSQTTPPSTPEIPGWIKNNADWWSQGLIGDSDFLQGIEFLIEQEIMIIPQTTPTSQSDDGIPGWVKNNAGWWSQGLIGDDDFIAGIQFLVENGIIVIDQPTSSQQESDNTEHAQSTTDSSSTAQKAKAILDYALHLQESGEEDLIEGAPVDGYPVAYYDVSGDDIVLKSSPSLSSELQHWQTDTEKHMTIWNLFTKLIPESQRNVHEVFITVDGIGGVIAGVNRDATDVSQWQMFYDVSDAFKTDTFDEKDLTYSIIHEHGHILTSGPDQLDVDIKLVEMINAGEDNPDLFDVKDEACFPRLMESDGCAKTNSYINQFYQKFWTDIIFDFYEIDNDAFYDKYYDQFVTAYAATNVGEDITESWTFFVLSDKPSGSGISQQKILFFYDYPELVDLREHIRNGL